MNAAKPTSKRVVPERGKTPMGTPGGTRYNPTQMKTQSYGATSLKPSQNKDHIIPPKTSLPRAEGLGLVPRQIGKLKTSLSTSQRNSKRKELSPKEKKLLYDIRKIPPFTQISDQSSMEELGMTEEELEDMWKTLSPDQKRSKKFDWIRRTFEPETHPTPKILGGQLRPK